MAVSTSPSSLSLNARGISPTYATPTTAGSSPFAQSFSLSYPTTPTLTMSSIPSSPSVSSDLIVDAYIPPETSDASSKPPPKKRGRRRTKIIDPTHIPRPPNSFIQFRRHWVKEQLELYPHSSNPIREKSLSKLAGEAWRKLTSKERAAWQKEAMVAKEDHMEKHPDYKFRPKRKYGGDGKGPIVRQRDMAFTLTMPPEVPSVTYPLESPYSAESSFSDNHSGYGSESGSLDVPSWGGSSVVNGPPSSPSLSSTSSSSHVYTPQEQGSPSASLSNFSFVPDKEDTTPTEDDYMLTPRFPNPAGLLQAQQQQQATLNPPSVIPYGNMGESSHILGIDLSQFPDPPFTSTQPLDIVPPSMGGNSDSHTSFDNSYSHSAAISPSSSSSVYAHQQQQQQTLVPHHHFSTTTTSPTFSSPLNDTPITDFWESDAFSECYFPGSSPSSSSGFFTDAERRAFGMDMIDRYEQQQQQQQQQMYQPMPRRVSNAVPLTDEIGSAFNDGDIERRFVMTGARSGYW